MAARRLVTGDAIHQLNHAALTPQVTVLANVLDRLIGANDTMVASRAITKFHALKPPSISVLDYLIR